jgi:hypothetical protein
MGYISSELQLLGAELSKIPIVVDGSQVGQVPPESSFLDLRRARVIGSRRSDYRDRE